MNDTLKAHLTATFAAFLTASPWSRGWAARRLAGDHRFFDRLEEPGATVTGRKYDEVMRAFGALWPAGAAWPGGVPKPGALADERVEP